MKIRTHALVLALVAPVLLSMGCNTIRAKSAFKDGNKLYKEEKFKQAIESYQHALDLDPSMAEAMFYLASSHQNLYRPGKDSPENQEHLDEAVKWYKACVEADKGVTKQLQMVKLNALAALTAVYSEPPYKSYDDAIGFAQQLSKENPDDPKYNFALANLYEKFDKVDLAEETYKRVAEQNPQDAKACAALAGFYNKPLWDGGSRFDDAIQTLQKCATIDASDPTGFYKVAVFYWDKAYRDPDLKEKQKDEYADKGLEYVNKALELKPEYVDALVYKGLLLRVKASVTTNLRLRQQYLDEAGLLAKQAKELRSQQQQQSAATPTPAS
jgi:tetratricopeptide (TPR) repeat protein